MNNNEAPAGELNPAAAVEAAADAGAVEAAGEPVVEAAAPAVTEDAAIQGINSLDDIKRVLEAVLLSSAGPLTLAVVV